MEKKNFTRSAQQPVGSFCPCERYVTSFTLVGQYLGASRGIAFVYCSFTIGDISTLIVRNSK